MIDIDPSSIAAGIVVGGGISTILTRMFALAKYRDALGLAADQLIEAGKKIVAHEQTAREQGRLIAELVAENFKHVCAERKRQAQRVAAAAKGRAVQKAKLAAKAAEAKAIRDARHAEMRDSLGVI